MRPHRAAAALAAVAGWAALAGGARDAAAQCARLGAAIVDHSCFHARLGPFADVTAGTAARPTADDLDAVHTYHRVALDARDAAAAVPYTPARGGAWAFYVQHDVPLAIRGPGGAALPVAHEDAVPGCPLLARVRIVELVAGATYQVALGPTPASEVGVVIERLDDFVAIHGRDRDRDGFGDPADVVTSACAPAAGYAANDADCDDADPATYPGAPERCDEPDRNCNGVAGDAGAACTAGTGACAAAGTAACPRADGTPVCGAAPGAPAAETCDGVDEDCDGVADAAEALCGDPELPRCVADGTGGRRCGCEADADCGAPDSARLCWLRGTEQRCIDGCIDGFGRNACPAGQRCTSADPARPGACVDAGNGDGGGCGAGGVAPGAAGPALAVLAAWLARRRRRPLGANQ